MGGCKNGNFSVATLDNTLSPSLRSIFREFLVVLFLFSAIIKKSSRRRYTITIHLFNNLYTNQWPYG